MKISVIIPAYNCGAYIGKQIESLERQDAEAEIIVVDNNSTDNTKEVVQSYPKVKLLQEEKQGVSAARNRGISEAAGEYVVFADADDVCEPNYLRLMLSNFDDENCSLSVCGYRTNLVSKDRWKKLKESPKEKDVLLWDEMLGRLFQTKEYQGYIWNKMFRKDVILSNGLRFDEDIYFNEDRLFIVDYLLKAKGSVVTTEKCLYNYAIREDSAMSAFRNRQRVSEKELTEFLAFEKMKIKIESEELSKVAYLLNEDMIQSELRCFKRMVSNRNIFQYRKSKMRDYAKKSREVHYDCQGELEDILLRIYHRYAWSGCTFTRNPDLFCNIGIL